MATASHCDTPEHRRARGWKPLDEFEPNGAVTIRSVFERDRKLLEYLHELGVRPGAQVEVIARNYDDTITLRIAGTRCRSAGPRRSECGRRRPSDFDAEVLQCFADSVFERDLRLPPKNFPRLGDIGLPPLRIVLREAA